MSMTDGGQNSNVWSQYMNRVKMWMAGVQFGGRRDLYQLFGYNRHPKQLDYVTRYLRQDIANRIVKAPVLACWADPPILDGGDAFNTAWEQLLLKHAIFHELIRLDKLAALGSFALMVIGCDDGKALNTPAQNADGRTLLYLQPYAEIAVKVKTWDVDPKSPRFNRPLMYTITPGRFTSAMSNGGVTAQWVSQNRTPFDVHYSRALHVAEETLEDPNFGRSRLECVVNILDDMLKVAGGSAEMFWLSANRGLQADVDKDMDLDPADEDSLTKEIQDYQNDLSRFIRTRGVKMTPLSGEKIDPTGIFNCLLALVSGATGIPKLVLIGTQQGQQASQQDRASWADRITERITDYEEPVVLLPFIAVLVALGILPTPSGLVVTWQEAFKLNPLERAQTSAQMARSAANLTKTFATLQPSPGVDAQGNAIPPPPVDPLFSPDEMRNMVSFGRNPPVFDKPKDGAGKPKSSKKSSAATSG